MKKLLLLLLSCLLIQSTHLIGQTYPSVFLEKKKKEIDQDNQIYVPGMAFTYDYQIIKDGQQLKLFSNSFSDWVLTPMNKGQKKIEAIQMVVMAPKNSQRTNKRQTEILYAGLPYPSFISTTGLVENEQNVWLHPIRTGFFKSLETCPFPFVKYPLEAGKKWTDQMIISDRWANELWGNWQGQLALKYEYQIVGKGRIETPMGQLDCWKIKATATSDIGQAGSTFLFSEKYGFVQLFHRLITGIDIRFTLQEAKKGEVYDSVKAFFPN